MRTGARILKTGLAVTISMYACLIFDVKPAIFASAAAVLNLQPSVGKSFHNAKEQTLVHFTSITIAIILGVTLGANPLTMGLSTILVISICNRLKWRIGMSGGIMATIFVLASPPEQFIDHALVRSLAIFIGVCAALLVNLTIARPKYEEPLRCKLIDLNNLIFYSFSEAVQKYLQLIPMSSEEFSVLNKKVGILFDEVQHLYDLYRYDRESFDDEHIKSKQKPDNNTLYRDYLTFNKGLWQRTKDIYFLAEERLKRRNDAGNLPISEEFQQILHLINMGQEHFSHHNKQLQKKIMGETPEYTDEPHIWSKLDDIINNWYTRFAEGSYQLHALIEVSLITYKIRWAVKETVHLSDTKYCAEENNNLN